MTRRSTSSSWRMSRLSASSATWCTRSRASDGRGSATSLARPLELHLFSELHKLACPAFRRLPPRKFGALTLKLKIEIMQCEKHLDTELVCPACAGEIGGRARANKLTSDQRREIARLGGLATRGRRKRRRKELRKEQPNGELRFPAPRRVRPIGDEW